MCMLKETFFVKQRCSDRRNDKSQITTPPPFNTEEVQIGNPGFANMWGPKHF